MSIENDAPIYYVTDNLNAAKTVSTDQVWPSGGLGLSLTGSGWTVGEWDGGDVLATHVELTGRVTDGDGAGTRHWHATHVAGTIMASGAYGPAKGMAYQASLKAYDWTSDITEMRTAAAAGLTISNHSYGIISGWYYDGTNWWWYGNNNNTGVNGTEDWQFGSYDATSQNWDQAAVDFPKYLMVVSAGNDRNDDPGAGATHFVWNGSVWVSSTTTRDPDGPWDSIPRGSGISKNTLTVGAVEDITAGHSSSSGVVLSSFSSTGPTDDGRIKPDIVANGVGLISAYDNLTSATNLYASSSGTSMSAPSVTGSLALLQQHYFATHGDTILAATLKALVIHTADEAGANDGPDYQFGWGLLNTASAAQAISDDQTVPNILRETSLAAGTGGTFSYSVSSLGTGPIQVTIVWNDSVGTPPGAVLDDTTHMLVNDLDLRITRDSDATVYYPWKLDAANPSNAATTGDNLVDNVEQVYIASPASGSYTVTVSHKGTLAAVQNFSIITTADDYTTTIAAPTGLVADAGYQTVTLTWSPNSESDFLRYRVYGGTASGLTTRVDSTTGGSLNDTTASITGLTNGTPYYYRVTAVDSTSNESDYSGEVTVTPLNTVPIASGDSVTTLEDISIVIAVLDNDSDPDGETLTISGVTQGSSGVVSIVAGNTTLSYLPSSDFFGADSFTYFASDGQAADTATVYVYVTAVNDAPVITSALATAAVEDSLYTYVGLATDAEGDALTWLFDQLPSWLAASNDSVSGTPPEGAMDSLFRAIVSDGLLSDTATVLIAVGVVNDAPVITSVASAEATEDRLFIYHATAFDPDGPALGWTFDQLPSWLLSGADSVFGTPLEGMVDTSFRVIASDGTLSDTLIVGVTVVPVNDPPVITSPATANAIEDIFFSYQATATDPEDSTITFSFGRLPSWLTAVADSAFGMPLEGTLDSSFRVIAFDGNLSDTLEVTVVITPVNDAPLLVANSGLNVQEGGLAVLTAAVLSASDPDNTAAELNYHLDLQPSSLHGQFLVADTAMGAYFTQADLDSARVAFVHDGSETTLDSIGFFVRDPDGAELSIPYFAINITPVNDLPEPITQLVPATGDTVDVAGDSLVFVWTKSSDVDSDTLWYDLLIAGPGVDTMISALVDTTLTFRGITSFELAMKYDWWIDVRDGIDTLFQQNPSEFTMPLVLALNNRSGVPESFALHQNYPNPFNPTSTIRFDLPETSDLELVIYDMRGRRIAILSQGSVPAGYHQVVWNGRDRFGRNAPSGIYIARMVTPSYTKAIKMVLLK
ncbi:MAG: tandem-95 repeat protein [Candidatus Marinimicrobia bacterium]|nr:tandem-95 repeat protein [Candidatus Neomarinimicrobiota bacterium]